VWIIVPAIPLVIAGQVCAIAALMARQRQLSLGGFRRRRRQNAAIMRDAMFSELPSWFRRAFNVASVGFWLLAFTAILPWISRGGPGASLPGCPYVLDDHGAKTCVSHATYLHAGAADQRFAAGLLTFFFLMHAATAWNTRAKIRRSS
jgi:hypothetical protein